MDCECHSVAVFEIICSAFPAGQRSKNFKAAGLLFTPIMAGKLSGNWKLKQMERRVWVPYPENLLWREVWQRMERFYRWKIFLGNICKMTVGIVRDLPFAIHDDCFYNLYLLICSPFT